MCLSTVESRSVLDKLSPDMFAVIGRELFSTVDPKRFGSLPKALITLFQLITLDDWFYMYTDIINVDPGIIYFHRRFLESHPAKHAII